MRRLRCSGRTKRDTVHIIAREVNFGAAAASTFWTERLAIETTTSMDIPVRNYLVHVWQFQCEIVFWW